MKQLTLVFIGGGTGSVLRFLIGKWLNNYPTSGIPLGTFTVNILGSLLIGLIFGYTAKHLTFSEGTLLFLATGFCGGFTTFSTFAYENQLFLRSGDYTSFAIYSLLSLILGFSAVFLGMWLIKII